MSNRESVDVGFAMSIIHTGYSELVKYLLSNMNEHHQEPIYKYIEMFTSALCQAGMVMDTENNMVYSINSIAPIINFNKTENEDFAIELDVVVEDEIPIPFDTFLSHEGVADILCALWNQDALFTLSREHQKCEKGFACVHNMIIYLSYMTDLICTAMQVTRYYFMMNLLGEEEFDPSKPHNQIATQLHLQNLWNKVANEVNQLVEINENGIDREILLAPQIFINTDNQWSVEFKDMIVQYREIKKKSV